VRGGPTIAGVLWEDPYAADGMGGLRRYHAGATITASLSRWFEIEGDLLLSRKGFRDRGGAHIGTLESDYLELPLLLKLGLPTRISPHLMVGPTAAFQLRCRVTGVAGTGEGGCDDPFIGMSHRKIDYGLLFGLGVSLPAGPGSISVDVLSDLGLRDFKEDTLPPGYARNVAFYLSLGFTVPVGQRSGAITQASAAGGSD
jgi:hypothetical protein